MAGDDPLILPLVTPLPAILATLAEQLDRLTRQVPVIMRGEAVRRRLMSVPGVGPITALAFRATIDRPERFRHSRDVGAHPGLTPSRDPSGETDIQGMARACMAVARKLAVVLRRMWSDATEFRFGKESALPILAAGRTIRPPRRTERRQARLHP